MKRIILSLLALTAAVGLASRASAQMVNAQTGTTYTVKNSDCGVIPNFLVTFNNASGVAVTLPQAGTAGSFSGGCVLNFANIGSGAVVITPTTSTINGSSSVTMTAGQSIQIYNDSIPPNPGNYWALKGSGTGGGGGTPGGSSGQVQYNSAGSFGGATSLTYSGTTVSNSGTFASAVGSNSAPTLTFTGDTTSGLYHVSSGVVGVTASGTQVGAWSTTGLNIVAGALQVAGNQAVNYVAPSAGGTGKAGGWFTGVGAGNPGNLSSFGYGLVGIGDQSLANLTVGGSETVAVGPFTCQWMTTALYVTCVGEHVIGYDNSSYMSGFGNDVFRDTVGESDSTAAGAMTQDDGIGSSNTSLGAFALHGNAGSVSIVGSPTTGDVYTLALATTSGLVSGLPANVTYTAVGGDTATSVANGLAAAIIAGNFFYYPDTLSSSHGVQVSAAAFNSAAQNVVVMHWPGGSTTGAAITVTPSCTGTCTSTLTYNNPMSATDTIAIGVDSVYAASLAGGLRLIGIGDFSLQNAAGASADTIAIGYQAAATALNPSKSVIIGNTAAVSATNISNDVIIAPGGLSGLTTGIDQVIIGAVNTNQNCITTGNNNVEIGFGACVGSPSTGNQMSIMDAVYGTGCNKGGGGSSNCQVGITQSAPGAKLDILGFDTTTTLALRVQNSTPAVLLSLTDAGVLTLPLIGSGSTGDYLCWNAGTVTEGTSVCSLSSRRWKENINPLPPANGLKEAMALKPVEFFYRPEYGDHGAHQHVGMIAEDTAEIDPRLVVYDDQNLPSGIDYQEFTAILLKAIQQEENQIVALQKQVAGMAHSPHH